METLKYLISFFLKIALAFFIFALVLGLLSIIFPAFKPTEIFKGLTGSSKKHSDLLPAPKRYTGLQLDGTNVDYQNNVYVPGQAFISAAPFDGYGIGPTDPKYSTYNYVVYSGTKDSSNSGYTQSQVATLDSANRAMYIRNLSLYEGSRVYNGLWFVGEAKSLMFRNGVFKIVIINSQGVVIGVYNAVASSKWAVPGWVRFEVKIDQPIPGSQVPCTMIFEEALTQAEQKTRQPVRVPLNVRCN